MSSPTKFYLNVRGTRDILCALPRYPEPQWWHGSPDCRIPFDSIQDAEAFAEKADYAGRGIEVVVIRSPVAERIEVVS